jgi:L-asparagine oxygenase
MLHKKEKLLDLLEEANYARAYLDPEVVAAFWKFKRDQFTDANYLGVLIVSDLEIGELPPTPLSTSFEKFDFTSEATLLAIAQCFGEPVGYAPEMQGHIVQDIFPIPGRETEQISTSSETLLLLHTESSFHPHRPKYLFLLCLRGDENAKTVYVPIRSVLNKLDKETLQILRRDEFTFEIDASFLEGGAKATTLTMPILSGTDLEFNFTYDEYFTKATTPEAWVALQKLKDEIQNNVQYHTLKAGQMMVIDNERVIHGRTSFTPRYDGTDRWLQRTSVVTDLSRSVLERDGRVINTKEFRSWHI